MNLYLRHIGDFNNATRHLTRVERSVYSDAIELYYDTEQPLQCVDMVALERRLLCRSDDEKQALAAVLAEFFDLTDAGYTHTRCDVEIAKYRANTSAKARAGIASAAARKQKSPDAEQKPTPVEHTSTNRKPLTVNHKPIEGERAKALPRPDDVDSQVWTDWVQLRKAKKAPVTSTVLKAARKEAAIAGMTLMAFLEIWCARGSQGLEAAWLRDADKPSRFAKPDPAATVPGKQARDPELVKAENDSKNRAPMPAHIREQAERIRQGATA